MSINSKTVKNIAKVLGVIFLVLMLIIGVCGFLLSTVFSGMCGNEISQEVYSPDNKYKVVVFQRDCGATTGFSTQVSVLKASAELPNEAGNIFVMDGHPDSTGVKINWETNRLVSIRYSNGYKVFERNDTIRILFTVINIKYNPVYN